MSIRPKALRPLSVVKDLLTNRWIVAIDCASLGIQEDGAMNICAVDLARLLAMTIEKMIHSEG